jgi:hypothetical protein
MFKRVAIALALTSAFAEPVIAQSLALDTARIEQATGMKGMYNQAENVYKISKPRANLTAVDGWKIPPFLGTSSYAAFTPAGAGKVLVMGDNVLLEDEVGPAMNAALENGLEVTALHNHFFFDQPKVYFMHIDGMGDTATIAAAVKKVLDAPDRIRSGQAAPATKYASSPVAAESHITGAPLETILGKKGEANNGMFKVSFGRPVKMHGINAGDAMGVNTWAGFAGTDDQAMVDGDFAVLEDELQPVLKSLRKSGINIVAIHQHMTHETPRLIFFHYWGQGKALDLAKAVRAAINLTSTKVS